MREMFYLYRFILFLLYLIGSNELKRKIQEHNEIEASNSPWIPYEQSRQILQGMQQLQEQDKKINGRTVIRSNEVRKNGRKNNTAFNVAKKTKPALRSYSIEQINIIKIHRYNFILYLIKALNSGTFTKNEIEIYNEHFYMEFMVKFADVQIYQKDIIDLRTSYRFCRIYNLISHDLEIFRETSCLESDNPYFGLISLGFNINIEIIKEFFDKCSDKKNITCNKNYKVLDREQSFSKMLKLGFGFQFNVGFFQYFENVNTYVLNKLSTAEFNYVKTLEKIFFVTAITEKNEPIFHHNFWMLMAYMPEIIFYAKWRSKIQKNTNSAESQSTQKHNNLEINAILEMLNSYTDLCKAINNSNTNSNNGFRKDVTEIIRKQKKLKTAIHSLRVQILDYLKIHHFNSIQFNIYKLGMALIVKNGIHTPFKLHNRFICLMLAFNIDSDEINKYISVESNRTNTKRKKSFSAFLEVFVKHTKRAADTSLALKNIVKYLRNQKKINCHKVIAKDMNLKLLHLFFNHMVILKKEPTNEGQYHLNLAYNRQMSLYYYNEIMSIILSIENNIWYT